MTVGEYTLSVSYWQAHTCILQANRAAFNQYALDPTCKLCQVVPETRQHFIGECMFFEDERRIYTE